MSTMKEKALEDELKFKSVLDEVSLLVHGDRGEDYGHPLDDFTRTGKMWAAILGLKEVTPEQVSLCMVALKISREVNAPKRDNRMDGAGYFETLEMVICEKEVRGNRGDIEKYQNENILLEDNFGVDKRKPFSHVNFDKLNTSSVGSGTMDDVPDLEVD